MIDVIGKMLVVCSLASAAPTVEQVLTRYEQAVGGTAALARMKTLVRKGYIQHGSGKVPFEWTSLFPGQWRGMSVWPRIGPTSVAFDGRQGWRQTGGAAVQPLSRDETLLESFIQDARIVSKLRQIFPSLSAVRTQTRGGREVLVIVARRPENIDERILPSDPEIVFDLATGLLVQLGPLRFDDYREAGGVKLAHRISFAGDHMVYIVTEVRHNVPVDASQFKAR
jgi:hypothetical protein